MRNILFFVSLWIYLCAFVAEAQSSTPNVLIVVYDDLDRLGDLGPYGAPSSLQTPFSDLVAGQGKRFDTFYANSSICSPTRVGLLTGLYPSRLGYTYVTGGTSSHGIPGTAPTLAGLFKGMGYRTGAFGKWHAGKNHPDHLPAGVGFDQSAIHCTYTNIGAFALDEPFPGAFGVTYDDALFCRAPGDVRQDSGNTYATTYTVDKAIEFINGTLDLPAGELPDPNPPPFFAQVWLHAPHNPLTCPPGHTCPSCDPQQLDSSAMDYCSPADYRSFYEQVVAHAEAQLMRLYTELLNRGEWNDTLVIVTSDNGATERSQIVSSQLRGRKSNLFERGIRVPFVIRGPGIAQGVVDEPVIGHDLLVTLAEHFQQTLPGYDGSGVAFGDLIWGDGTGWQGADRPMFWELREPSEQYQHALFFPWKEHAVRKQVLGKSWKLVHSTLYGKGPEPELYKLSVDPAEVNDLVHLRPEVRHHLESELRHWRREEHAMTPIQVSDEGAVTTHPDGSWTFDVPANGQDYGIVHLADHPALTLDNLDLSVSFTFTPSRNGFKERLMGREGSWWIILRTDHKLQFRVDTTAGPIFAVNPLPIVAGETYRVTAVYHHNRGVYLSIDDQHAKERVHALNGVDTAKPLVVGRLTDGGEPFVGTISDLLFHPIVLSTDELELDTVYGTGFEPGEPMPFSSVHQGTLTVDTNTVHSGSQSLRHEASQNDSYTFPWFGTPAASAGVDELNIQFSAWVKGDGGAEDPVSLFLFCLDGSGNILFWDPRAFSHRQDLAIDSWRRIVHHHQCPSGTQAVNFRLDNDVAGRTVYWDDIRISRGGRAYLNLDFENEVPGQGVQSIFASDGFPVATTGYTGGQAIRLPAFSESSIQITPYGGRNQFVTSLWAKADGPGVARLRIWHYCYQPGSAGLEAIPLATGNCPQDAYPHSDTLPDGSPAPTDPICIRSFPATLNESWQKYQVWSSCPDLTTHTGLRLETYHAGPDVLVDDLTYSVPSAPY